MKIFIFGEDEILDGVSLLSDDLGITTVPENEAEVILEVSKADINHLSVSLDGKRAKIVYGGGKSRFFRAFGILCDAVKNGKNSLSVTENPIFDTDGPMFDESRNAVMKPETVEFILRKIALMGMNTFMLYTEDTYEVKARPYFGYMRGRYSEDEIKRLDSYAVKLGIEMIPCVQTLGHLATYLRWSESAPYRDTANVLLAGEEKTYAFLDDLFRTVSSLFTSRRVHVGMDETHDLGTGKYLDANGYRERSEIYFKHLDRVAKLAEKYGLKPMMWSDMFFRLSGKDLPGYEDYDPRVTLIPGLKDRIPANMQLVFWDYYHPDENFYDVNLKKHATLGENTVFGGGVWCWSGHSVQLSRSIRNTVPALTACKKNGTREVLATVWHNCAESSLVLALSGLAMYAEFDYLGRHDEDAIRAGLFRVCGISWDDVLLAEKVEYSHGDPVSTGSSRVLLYNDPLCGMMDKHVENLDTGKYFRSLTPEIEKINEKDSGEFSPAFEVYARLSDFLENKSDFGVRLKQAYDAGDREKIKEMRAECDEMRRKLSALRQAHRKAWMKYNKPFGWEVLDVRYGGLDARIETASYRIGEYLEGKTDRIEELEEKRLRFDGLPEDAAPFGGFALWVDYKKLVTGGVL